ncbi:suppressor of fused domain protein [bacterium]|nr:suppressor of fused domain protein [bacterium]
MPREPRRAQQDGPTRVVREFRHRCPLRETHLVADSGGAGRSHPTHALIFDGYPSYPTDAPVEFGLLAVIEVFRSEMAFARKNGGAKLLARLKEQGHYPYSDLDREPVA